MEAVGGGVGGVARAVGRQGGDELAVEDDFLGAVGRHGSG